MMNEIREGNLYNFFEKVYLISLKRRVGRRNSFCEQVNLILSQELWPFKSITIFDAIDGTKTGVPFSQDGKEISHHPGVWGCRISHIRIIELALINDWENVLIFEDDAKFDLDFFRNSEMLVKVFNSIPEDWDILYLGADYNSKKDAEAVGQVGPMKILKSNQFLNTHAYAISRRYLKTLYQHLNSLKDFESRKLHIDRHFISIAKKTGANVYKVSPCIVRQNKQLPRDIVWKIQIRNSNG